MLLLSGVKIMADEDTTQDIIRTPRGVVSRAEYEQLKSQYPEGIPATAVQEVVESRPEIKTPSQIREEEKVAQETKEATESITDLSKLTREQYKAIQGLSDKEQFDLLVKLGHIPEGSQFVKGMNIDYSKSGLTQEQIDEYNKRTSELTGKPVNTWGFYTKEQLEEISKAETEKQKQVDFQAQQRKLGREYKQSVFERENTQLPDGQWVSNKELSQLQSTSPDLYKVMSEQGYNAYKSYFDFNYIKLPDNQYIKFTDADKVLEQSEYGYNILKNEGFDAYKKAVDKALEDIKPYKRTRGYNLRLAAAQGVPIDTLSLIFPAKEVSKVENFYREPAKPIETIPQNTSLKIPTGLAAALPALGTAALVEPTPIGEVIVIALLAGGAAWYAIQEATKNKVGNIDLNIAKQSVQQAQTRGQPVDKNTLVTINLAGDMATVGNIADAIATVPQVQEIAQHSGQLYKPGELKPVPHIYEAGALSPLTKGYEAQARPAVTKGYEAGVLPPQIKGYEAGTLTPSPRVAEIMASQSAVAVAEKDLEDKLVFIRARVAETGINLPAIVPKTEKALIALDQAVQDAFTAGVIDNDTLRVYSQARTNYLTKKGLLDSTMKTYIGGMQPELADNTINVIATATSLAISNLQQQAQQTAQQTYTQALIQGLSQEQAQQVAQSAVQQVAQTQAQQAVQNAVNSLTQAQSITDTTTISAIQSAVQTATGEIAKSIALTNIAELINVPPLTPFLFKLPLPEKVGGDKDKKQSIPVEQGAIVFKMGALWKVLTPDWTQDKFYTLGKGQVPQGANTSGRTPEETLQVIGTPSAKVPESISIDLGITDIEIYNYGQNIRFGYGLYTDVGESLESTTTGLSIPSVFEEKKQVRKNKVRKLTRRSNNFSDLISMKGVRL